MFTTKELRELRKKRDAFIMKNAEQNIEVKCTAKFIRFWEERGFEVLTKQKMRLIG